MKEALQIFAAFFITLFGGTVYVGVILTWYLFRALYALAYWLIKKKKPFTIFKKPPVIHFERLFVVKKKRKQPIFNDRYDWVAAWW